jgi:2-aminoethylphosphonate-pyruvate transaminase
MEKKYLFAPGPVLTTDKVKNAALIPDLCHRRGDFERIYSDLRKRILKIVNASEGNYLSVVVTGSGSAANECVVSSVFKENSKALVIGNGEFGNRLKGFTECYGIETVFLDFEWGGFPDINKIEDKLKNDSGITHILMVMHETSGLKK